VISRPFGSNRLFGIRRTFHEDPTTGLVTVETEQDVTAALEESKALYNRHDEHSPWGDVNLVAQIPLSVRFDPKLQHIFSDPKKYRAWLNDPDQRAFRTRPGRL
jgi:hypothetical protein